jgi:WD40 repeat protein/serine/threonine protein kinase
MSEQTIVLAALALADPAERARFLDRACAGDAALRDRVEQRLAAHEQEDEAATPTFARPAQGRDQLPTQPLDDPYETPTVPVRRSNPAADDQAPHHSFGAYELLRFVARGGMGVVYKARHRKLQRVVALKMILAGHLASADEVRRFYQEAEAAAQLDHPGIVPIYEVGLHEGQHFYAMGFVEGGSLEARVREGPLPPRAAAALVERVAEAVAYAHQKGIIHRDLKPSNVLLDEDGQPRVTDFGLARQVQADSRLTVSGQVIGTPSYMPPEQARGRNDVGPAADVYSLGALLYCLVTGRPPFQGATPVDTLRQVLDQDPPAPRQLNARVDRDLETICLKCLHKEPAKRYAGARSLAEDLGRFRRGEPVHARPVSRLEHLGRWGRRNPAVAALLATLFSVLALGLVGVSWQWSEAVGQRRRAEKKTEDEAAARALAQRYAQEAEQKRQDEAQARSQAQQLSAHLLLERGLGLCQQGEYDRGLLWLVRGLDVAPTEAPDLRDSLRTLLGGWSARLCPCRLVLTQPRGVRAAASSADGRIVAAASGDAAHLWDATTGQAHGPTLRHTGPVRAVAVTPDGQFVLTGSDDHTAQLWKTATGRPVGGPMRHPAAVEHVAFSPDGKVAVTAGKDGTARLWDAGTGRLLEPLLGHTLAIRAVAFSPDSRLLLTGSNDFTARLWEVPSGKPHAVPLPHNGAVRGVAFSPDGKQVLTGSNDRNARMWDVASGKLLLVLAHTKPVPGVAFHPGGRVLATGCEDRTAREWDARTGKPIAPALRHDEEVARVAYSGDGRLLLTGGWARAAWLWEAGTDRPAAAPLRHHGGLTTAAFSHDGSAILTASDDHTVRLWRVSRPLLPTSFPRLPGPVLVATFSPDGETILAAGGDRAWLCKARTGEQVAGPLLHPAPVLAGTFSPGGKTVLTSSVDGSAWLWDAATGRRLAGPFRHPDPVHAVAFRPDGKVFATGSGHSVRGKQHMEGRGEARVWDLASGKVIHAGPRHARDTLAVAFTADGKTLVTASKDGTARFWNAATGQVLGASIRHRGWVNAVALAPDGRSVLTGSDDQTARLWAVPDASPRTLPLRHMGPVKAVAVSNNGRLLLTGSEDGSAQLWDARLGQPIDTPLRTPAPLSAVGFSPDGRLLLTGDRDGWVRVWKVPAPLGGDVKRIGLWVEVAAGTDLDDTGTLQPLDARSWNERRQRLDRLGGPPPGAQE